MASEDLSQVPTYRLLQELDRRSNVATVERVEAQIKNCIAYVEGWLDGRDFDEASAYLRNTDNVDEIVDHMLDDDCSPFSYEEL